jgi:hypothetical protein
MSEGLIKSKKRVQQHGEVFTPAWMVKKMLDTPGIKEACENIYATFLEPAAGDGNFLLAILERKLKAVTEQYDKRNWKTKALVALASIYGIEYLADNLDVARSRMFNYYLDWYEEAFGERLNSQTNIYKSANYIIHKNIVRGNTLTKRHPITEEPIRMIEWQKVPGYPSKVRAVPFAFAELFGEEVEEEKKLVMEQLSLFEWEDEVVSEPEVEKVITEIEIQKVYLLGDYG